MNRVIHLKTVWLIIRIFSLNLLEVESIILSVNFWKHLFSVQHTVAGWMLSNINNRKKKSETMMYNISNIQMTPTNILIIWISKCVNFIKILPTNLWHMARAMLLTNQKICFVMDFSCFGGKVNVILLKIICLFSRLNH